MIFTEKKLIYLHIQKTGGNSVSQVLLPFSDDEMYLRKHQDGVNRFSVTGEFTTRKHAMLAEYKAALGPAFDQYRVLLPVRDPFERAISLYYSPHKWLVQKDDGWVAEPSYWDFGKFEQLATKMQSLCDFLTVDGQLRKPDFLLRFDHLSEDFNSICKAFDFPVRHADLPVTNTTSASQDNLAVALRDDQARTLIGELFAADYELLIELESATSL